MEVIQKKVDNTNTGGRILKICIFSFLLFLGTAHSSISQESDSAATQTDSSSATSDSGPSVANLSKTMAAGNEEMKRLKEKARHDEIMSYIYMGLGFSVVIAIAWFTTVLAKKRKKKENEAKLIRAQHQPKHKVNHHHPRR